MHRESFFKIYGVDFEAFKTKHGIDPFEIPCKECGVQLITNVPCRNKQYVGLMSENCECGNKDVPYCFILEELK